MEVKERGGIVYVWCGSSSHCGEGRTYRGVEGGRLQAGITGNEGRVIRGNKATGEHRESPEEYEERHHVIVDLGSRVWLRNERAKM